MNKDERNEIIKIIIEMLAKLGYVADSKPE